MISRRFSSISASSILLFSLLVVYTIERATSDYQADVAAEAKLSAGTISAYVNKNLTQLLGSEKLLDLYKERKSRGEFSFERFDIEGLLADSVKKLDRILQIKMSALINIVQRAQNLTATYTYDDTLQKENVTYRSSRQANEDPLYVYDEFFLQPVVHNESDVHVPIEVYDGGLFHLIHRIELLRDPDVLNRIRLTEGLNEVFAANREKDPNQAWQYICTSVGVMRSFPAQTLKTPEGQPDMYDCRLRPWYTQGSSSPKDVLIMIDTSGSVTGQPLELMKITIRSLLDSLGENDFIAIMGFNEAPYFISCFQHFVQANSRHKKKIFQAVQDIQPKGMADFTGALEFGFNLFDKFNRTDATGQPLTPPGSGCNQVMMILTDGTTQELKAVYEKYNYPSQKVRIFTYVFGPLQSPTVELKRLACNNRGYYSEIPAMGAIRSKVQDYSGVLFRPLALHHAPQHTWASVYEDEGNHVSVVARPLASAHPSGVRWTGLYQDARGLGMITSVTSPVYDQSPRGTNQTILGVAGVDLPVAQFTEGMADETIGATGYAFIVDHNGYILYHPRLKPQTGFLKDPPNVDLLELEVDDDDRIRIRKAMIDGQPGKLLVNSTPIMIGGNGVDDLGIYVQFRNVYYYYDKLTDSLGAQVATSTNFGLGFVVADYDLKKVTLATDDAQSNDFYKLLSLPSDLHEVFIAWRACGLKNLTGKLLLARLQEKDLPLCTPKLLKHALFDLNVTDQFSQYWLNLDPADRSDAEAFFVGTAGGVTRLLKTHADVKVDVSDDPWNDTYYQRAIDFDFTVVRPFVQPLDDSALPNDTESTGRIMLSKAIQLDTVRLAVVGAQTKIDAFSQLLRSQHVCGEHDCFLLDDGAFIVAATLDDGLVGSYFGKSNPAVMNALFNGSFYKRNEEYDYQASCDLEAQAATDDAAFVRSWMAGIVNVFSLRWWERAFSLGSLAIYNLFFSFSLPPYRPVEAASPKAEDRFMCIKRMAQYYFGSVDRFYKPIDCSASCVDWEVYAERVEHTNLALVVVTQPGPNCNCEMKPPLRDPISHEGPDVCDASPRYRHAPDDCFDSHPSEDSSQCGGAVQLMLSLLTTFLALTLALFG